MIQCRVDFHEPVENLSYENCNTVNSLINPPLFNISNAERHVYLEVKNYFLGQVAHK